MVTKYNMVIITENYHVISIFKFLVPLSDCQQIVQKFDKRKIIMEWRLVGKYALGKILMFVLECINWLIHRIV